MAIDITANLTGSVGGPSVARSITPRVDAYDPIDVSIADGAADEAGGNDADDASHERDRELLLAGAGALGLRAAPPNQLLFTNATGQAISVPVLIGRNAT